MPSVIRRVGAFVMAIDAVALVLDYLIVTYLYLSFLWNWLPALSVAGRVSTLLFLEGGVLAAIGALVGGGIAESEVAGRVPSGGVTAGPELQGKVARERSQMRDEQLGFGLKALAMGLSLVLLSIVIALL